MPHLYLAGKWQHVPCRGLCELDLDWPLTSQRHPHAVVYANSCPLDVRGQRLRSVLSVHTVGYCHSGTHWSSAWHPTEKGEQWEGSRGTEAAPYALRRGHRKRRDTVAWRNPGLHILKPQQWPPIASSPTLGLQVTPDINVEGWQWTGQYRC